MNKLKKTKKINTKIYLHYFQPKVPIDSFDFVDVNKIDKIKDSSYEEIIIQDLLEYYNDSNAMLLLNKIVSKIKPGGKLHIQGLDSKALCYGVVYSQVDTMTLKMLLFGAGKSNVYTLSQIKSLISSEIARIKINKIKFLNGLQYYIEYIKDE